MKRLVKVWLSVVVSCLFFLCLEGEVAAQALDPDPCDAADVNASGRVGTDDIIEIILAWHTTDPAADVNDDNFVNGSDLTIVLQCYGYEPPDSEGVCNISDSNFENFSLDIPQSGLFLANFSATPLPDAGEQTVNAHTMLSSGEGGAFSDFAVIVRFNGDGFIDVRNGDGYMADVAYPYSAGTTYNFVLGVDVDAARYDVEVMVEGQDVVTLLAENYEFRTQQNNVSELDTFAIQATSGSHEVCDFTVDGEEPECGDGDVQSPESCDDGNLADGDGCSATCSVEDGYICSGEPSVCEIPPPPACSDGEDNDGDGLVDMEDPGCASVADSSEEVQTAGPQPRPTCEEVAGSNTIYFLNPASGQTLANNFPASSLQGGDVVCLLDGNHGSSATLSNLSYSTVVTVMAQQGQEAVQIGTLELNNLTNIKIDGLRIMSSGGSGSSLVTVSNSMTNVVLANSELRSAPEGTLSSWSLLQWRDLTRNGVRFMNDVNGFTLRNNYLRGVFRGIKAQAGPTLIGNIIDGFSADGVRLDGSGAHFVEGNIIMNPIANPGDDGVLGTGDDLHPDGIQFFAGGIVNGNPPAPTTGSVVRSTQVYDLTDSHPNPSLAWSMQGISKFDGPCNNCVFENNIVIVDHNHGISMHREANNSLFANNTVVGIAPSANNCNNGCTPLSVNGGSNNTVINNLVSRLSVNGSATVSNNIIVNTDNAQDHISNYVVDPTTNNYHLKPGSPAIDAGTSSHNPPGDDFEGDARPQGAAVDIGADEFTQGD